MIHQQTLNQLSELKLHAMAENYQAVLNLPHHQQPKSHELIAQLTQAEMLDRINRRSEMLIKLSNLRYPAQIEHLQYGVNPNLQSEQIHPLLDCKWINRAENILITGATGCGKSYLACALGYHACSMGYKVQYLNINRFIEKLTLSRIDGSFTKLLNYFNKIHLLIIDDFGLAPLTQDTKLALLQIMEDRYARKAMIIGSQIPVNQWFEYINEPTVADAILDRIVPKAHRFELKGESLRNK